MAANKAKDDHDSDFEDCSPSEAETVGPGEEESEDGASNEDSMDEDPTSDTAVPVTVLTGTYRGAPNAPNKRTMSSDSLNRNAVKRGRKSSKSSTERRMDMSSHRSVSPHQRLVLDMPEEENDMDEPEGTPTSSHKKRKRRRLTSTTETDT